MCGIFGYAGNASEGRTVALYELVQAMAAESEARGVDSTGFAARFDSGHTIVDKMPYRASIFTNMSHKFTMLERKMPSTFIGHTRLGTGSSPMINNNNHPFIGHEYYMVHNGVIPSWRDVVKTHQLPMSSETDSEVVLRLIEKQKKTLGLKKSIEWILDNVWGNMAIALLDKRDPHVWLFRNDNPIHVFVVDKSVFGGEITLFCSTKQIFDAAWKRAFNKKPANGVIKAHYLDDNHLFRISTNGISVKGKIERFIVRRLDVKRKFRVKKQYYGATVGATDETGRYSTVGATECFYSKVVDVSDVSKGCRFTDKQQSKMREILSKKDGKNKIQIDGMHVNEYASLKTLVGNTSRIEEAMSNEGYFYASHIA